MYRNKQKPSVEFYWKSPDALDHIPLPTYFVMTFLPPYLPPNYPLIITLTNEIIITISSTFHLILWLTFCESNPNIFINIIMTCTNSYVESRGRPQVYLLCICIRIINPIQINNFNNNHNSLYIRLWVKKTKCVKAVMLSSLVKFIKGLA